MVRGRKPKPTALKLLQGNPGKRPLNKNEPTPPATAPGCPAWLAVEAKAEWRRVVPTLDRLGMLAKIDRAALAAYCSAWATFVAAEADIARYGIVLTVPVQEWVDADENVTLIVKRSKNPAVLIAQDARAQLRQYCAEFGLTPSARSRMELPDVGGGGADARNRHFT